MDLAWEVKKFWNIKVTMEQALFETLGTVSKILEKWQYELEISLV